jgi:phosphate transport system substrate-binding protein
VALVKARREVYTRAIMSKHLGSACLVLAAGCAQLSPARDPVSVRYVGSSTVAVFLRDAEPLYGGLRIEYDTAPESEGGEQAILSGEADLAGTARRPAIDLEGTDIVATLIGRDAVAVIVNERNPVSNLSFDQLRLLFTGKVSSWKEVGGPDLPVRAFAVGSESATRKVFRDAVLSGRDVEGCTEVRPDRDIIASVANDPGGIGHISFSFLSAARGVRPVRVEGQEATVTNFGYPITRPLYLLWRAGNSHLEAFAVWIDSDEAQRVVLRHFVGTRVIDSVRAGKAVEPTGTLVVETETERVYDGGIDYYPHRPYEILSRGGELLRRIPNHRGKNDESPMRVRLAAGTYLIRVESAKGTRPEFFVTVEPGITTEVDVAQLLRDTH